MKKISVRKAINQALQEEMLRDEKVILFGEDIAFYGGSLKVTSGLYDQFGPERVRDTPISEAAIIGTANGLAMEGMRPVAEITYIDFVGVCMDQIMNQAAKWQYMSAGSISLPLVIRTQGGAYRGNASQHSQSLEAFFVHIPGLVVIQPSTPFDFKGLLKSAIRDQNPVLFIEHKLLYNTKGFVPEEEYLIPFGSADIKREGSDVTILATSFMVKKALEAADLLAEEGINVEIVDPRTLNPFDYETLFNSVKKTKHLVVVVEAYRTGSLASEIAARVQEEIFSDLAAPILCIGAVDVPIPYATNLEEYMLPSTESIYDAVKKSISYKK
jgi:pyruvate/2-oxoglutarate/acetoin dehydrogenase E1 component